MKNYILLITFILATLFSFGQKNEEASVEDISYSGLSFRNIGPALTSGRIADIAVNPGNHAEYYLAVASGGVWKTSNSATTFEPVFDSQGSYSIGCVTLDPNNSNVVWVGTGENNNQRSVAYGDGIYKSVDGGKSWENKGLKNSEHIGNIVVHPENSNVVFASAYGPLWNEGGERGLYKSTDGGETWEKILEVNEHTGINEVHLHPENPEVMFATAHQRRRHVFTYLGGGPGSAVYKSTDGGKNWRELKSGLPSSNMGRIGMDISPADPDYIYAIIEAEKADESGFYRSTDLGESWSKMSGYKTSGNYYQELVCDPYNKDKVFAMDTWLHHTENGGKKFKKTREKSKHVDNHCMWIDPNDTNHWILGCDGGVYETWDHANTWNYKSNLPITQFYKVAVDNEEPFYYVYGGTQDNNTIGGPSRTINNHGIMNSDWFITNGGDGFEAAIDPVEPNIVYAQSQYGWLVRFDKQSGETIGIKPIAREGEKALRWNWDAPLIISPHDHKRLYFAANKLFRSDDRGNTWKVISPDLTRQLDRNQLKVMGRVQSADAVMKNKSTSIYGNIVALDESPLVEDLIYVGTDDGLVQVSEDSGENWRKVSSFPGVPERTYVNALVASKHDASMVFAVFNNHKNGDFKPYILKSTDKGKSWKSINGDLPERGSVYDIAQDHEDANLLFAGTEFGAFFSMDGGKNWKQFKAGLPTIAIRDIEIQERENDLVLASFGRGFFVLDDYSPLRNVSDEVLEKQAHIFPIKEALMYVEASPLGLRGKGSQGENHFTAPNPPVGAVFTYYLNEEMKTLSEERKANEAKLIDKKLDVAYPTEEELRAEDNEQEPYLLFTVYNEAGEEIRKIREKPSQGVNRVVWDFRHTPRSALRLKERSPSRYGQPDMGPMALPGKYFVSLHKVEKGEPALLVEKTPFECKWLNNLTMPAEDNSERLAFQEKVEKLRRAVDAAQKVKNSLDERIKYIRKAVESYPGIELEMLSEVDSTDALLRDIEIRLNGDRTLASREFETPESISSRVGIIIWSIWQSRSAPTQTSRMLYEDAGNGFEKLRADLETAVASIEALEEKLEEKDAPFTPGRGIIEKWKME
jgi:photosystem II stability/assembly factor-like uncharacterized protein/exonuclease VII small subunit